jgi:N-acetylglucosamine-6-phosphate deacetylase
VVAADRLLAPEPVEPPLLAVADSRVVAVGAAAATLGVSPVALRGTLTPGLIDLQVNGGAGVSLQEPAPDLRTLHAWLRAGGVLAYQPTLVSAPLLRMAPLAAALARVGVLDGVQALRPHLEGPFISPLRLGAHDAAAVAACDAAALRALAVAWAGMVTLAPERDGAFELLHVLAATGVRVSVGHCNATFAQAETAFAAGAVMVTHLFNAMPPLHHRAPGLAGAALGGAHRPFVGLIADGVHVDPAMCVMAARLLGERLVLVSDAAPSADCGEVAPRLHDGRLAGAAARLDDGVRNMVAWGVDPSLVVHAASGAPARVLGLHGRGALAPGLAALVALWDDEWRITAAGPVEELVAVAVAS